MKINVVLPTLHIDDQFRATIDSLSRLEDVLGRVIVVAPDKICKSSAAAALAAIEFIPERYKGIYPCFNQSIDALSEAKGYVLFIGAGDIVLGMPKALRVALIEYPEVVMTGVVRTDGPIIAAGEPEYLFRTRGRLLYRLPHHQGILYRADVVRLARYPEGYKIYGDVLQRAKVLRTQPFVTVEMPFIATAPAGVSSYNDWHRIRLHVAERLRLFIPLAVLGEPLLAGRYVAGIGKVLSAAVEHSFRPSLKKKL